MVKGRLRDFMEKECPQESVPQEEKEKRMR